VQITTTSGCDTTLSAEVLPLPLPIASFDVDSVVCKGDPLFFTNTSDAPVWSWYFAGLASARDRHPQHTYTTAGIQQAMLVVENIERCRDTLRKQIQVKQLDLSLTATPPVSHQDEVVTLQTHAPEPYLVTAWLPEPFFADQQAFHQSIPIDTTRYFTVMAQSAHGCIDTATVLVTIHPLIFLPTAFSPNGDGRNDYYRPAIRGEGVTIRSMRVFDRWGREVWSGQGSAAFQGWDGTYSGNPAQVGTYYYSIEAETHTGKTIREKGDLTLVR
jgi:gliding motility-associated-like protein